MNSDQIIDLLATYHHLLALESARLVPDGFTQIWVSRQTEEGFEILHKYTEAHKHLALGAMDQLGIIGAEPAVPQTNPQALKK